MVQSDDAGQAEVFDFLNDYLDDIDRGSVRSLAEYLARHPAHQEAIAREWLARQHASPETSEEAGERRVGPYRLVLEVGRGGQGSVWLAEDTRIARRVALKIFESGMVSSDRRMRMRREAEVIARLDHPGICAIHEAVVEGEMPYIAMRYVEGAVLARALDGARLDGLREPLPWIPRDRAELERVLRFFERAARALHAAHEAGIVHRDVKPANLMVTPAGEPVILDFGLARDETAELQRITQSGETFGTPGYTSPEQLRGSDELDRRTDVWSLGVTLYEALTGERPFDAATRYELERAIVGAPLPDARARNAALTEDVRVVLETALEKDRGRRYPSALELAEDLRRIREYEPIHARPAGTRLRLRRWTQRQPALATAVIGTIVLLATALTITAVLLRSRESALSVARGRHLAERALDMIDRDPGFALLLAIEAADRAPTHLTRSALFQVLDACKLEKVFVAPVANRMLDLDLVSDAQSRLLLAAASDEGHARVWDLRAGTQLADLDHPGEVVRRVALHPSGEWLATASGNGILRVFAWESGSLLWSKVLTKSPPPGSKEGKIPLLWLEYDPSGKRLAVLAKAEGGWVLDARTGEVLARIEVPASAGAGRAEQATMLRFSPDGSLLLAASSYAQRDLGSSPAGWVFDAQSGARKFALTGHSDAITWAEFDPVGERIVTASRDGTVRLWSARTGEPQGPPLVHEGVVTCATFDRSGTRLATTTVAGERSRAVVWSLADRIPHELPGHEGPIVHAAFSPDGALLATASLDLSTRVWDVSTAEPRVREVLRALFMPLESLWTDDGSRLVTLSNSARAHSWSMRNMPYVYALQGHEESIVDVAFDSSGERALTASSDGTVRVWATPSGACPGEEPGRTVLEFRGHSAPIVRAGFLREGKEILSASGDGTIRRFSSLDGAELAPALTLTGQPMVALAWSEASDRVLGVDSAGNARLWRLLDGARISDYEGATGAIAFDPDGRRFAIGLSGTCVTIHDSADGRELRIAPADARLPDREALAPILARGLAFQPGSGVLAIANEQQEIDFVHPTSDARNPRTIRLFPPRRLEYDSTGTHLLVSGDNWGSVRMIDLETGTIPNIDVLHVGPITTTTFDRSGDLWLSAARDGSVFVWETASCRPIVERPCGHGHVLCAAFSPAPGPTRVIAGCEDGSAVVFPIDPLPAARARAPRKLDRWEVEQEERLEERLAEPSRAR